MDIQDEIIEWGIREKTFDIFEFVNKLSENSYKALKADMGGEAWVDHVTMIAGFFPDPVRQVHTVVKELSLAVYCRKSKSLYAKNEKDSIILSHSVN